MSIKVLEFREVRKGSSLRGFAKVQFASGLIVNDVTVLVGDRGPWASPPSKPRINSDGTVQKSADGKILYTPIIDFASREIRARWSDAVIEAVRAAHPEVLA